MDVRDIQEQLGVMHFHSDVRDAGYLISITTNDFFSCVYLAVYLFTYISCRSCYGCRRRESGI